MRATNYSKIVDNDRETKEREEDLKNIVDEQMRTFRERLKKHFAKKETMTYEELGNYTYASRQTLSEWCKNSRTPTNIVDLCTIANLLNCEVGYLVGEFDCKNRKVADVMQETGLSEQTIAKLKTEKVCGDIEIANFIDWLVSHPEFIHLIKVIDKANVFSENPKKVLADIGNTVEEMDMFSIYKTHINDMFWKIIEDYHIGSIRIEGESDAK